MISLISVNCFNFEKEETGKFINETPTKYNKWMLKGAFAICKKYHY